MNIENTETKSNNKGLIIGLVILSLLVVGLGGYIAYDKFISEPMNEEKSDTDNTGSKNYILDFSKPNQSYRMSIDKSQQKEIYQLGYIKLDNKEYKVTYTPGDPNQDRAIPIINQLKIGDWAISYVNDFNLYLLPNAILFQELDEYQDHYYLTLVDFDLNGMHGIGDTPDYISTRRGYNMIDWDSKTLTYYQLKNEVVVNDVRSATFGEYKVDFSSGVVKAPELIREFETTDY